MAQKSTGTTDARTSIPGSFKYDILSALAVAALSQRDRTRIEYMRLIALLTARYDWRRSEVSIGHAQLAELWSIDVRSVKRQIARFVETGLMTKKRTGVRGRVSVYKINLQAIAVHTRPAFNVIGPDFEERIAQFLGETVGSDGEHVLQKSAANCAPRDRENASNESNQIGTATTVIDTLCEILPRPSFERWFSRATLNLRTEGIVEIQFPTQFHTDYAERTFEHALTEAVQRCHGRDCRWRAVTVMQRPSGSVSRKHTSASNQAMTQAS